MIFYYFGFFYLIFFFVKLLESLNYIKVIVGISLFFFNLDVVRGVLVYVLCIFFFLIDFLFLVEL